MPQRLPDQIAQAVQRASCVIKAAEPVRSLLPLPELLDRTPYASSGRAGSGKNDVSARAQHADSEASFAGCSRKSAAGYRPRRRTRASSRWRSRNGGNPTRKAAAGSEVTWEFVIEEFDAKPFMALPEPARRHLEGGRATDSHNARPGPVAKHAMVWPGGRRSPDRIMMRYARLCCPWMLGSARKSTEHSCGHEGTPWRYDINS
ncbi:hypothetical protein JOH48_001602 [Bradyrhizobium elkanii]|nr:hypothetical protein [Bradyrhizobium elkanii]